MDAYKSFFDSGVLYLWGYDSLINFRNISSFIQTHLKQEAAASNGYFQAFRPTSKRKSGSTAMGEMREEKKLMELDQDLTSRQVGRITQLHVMPPIAWSMLRDADLTANLSLFDNCLKFGPPRSTDLIIGPASATQSP
ncbi:hypothetical protein HAX54_032944 [Datura stramonium]|uniref:Uncharacterized protein n=1 Tax=Datura stramonium TaxID=4076 RepID=A0ABS8VEF8_DATST|nr:hypothetical protein [Datura stramonium]